MENTENNVPDVAVSAQEQTTQAHEEGMKGYLRKKRISEGVKKKIDTKLVEFQEACKEGEVEIGENTAIKRLKLGTCGKVYVSASVSEETLKLVSYLAGQQNIDVETLAYSSVELGGLIGKPFGVSIAVRGELK